MSAFLPESDSEDELPPGWEERATLQGEVSNWQFWQPIIWEWNVLFCIPFITGLLCKPWPVLHTMATPEDRKEENSRRKLAIWLGEENSIGQQGISAFARMNLDNFAFWGCIRGLGQQEDHIHRPSIGFCKRNCHCLDNLPTKVWLWKHRFTGLWNHTMQVSQVKFISPGGPWQGLNRTGGFGDWCQQWRWLANSSDSCFTRLSGLNQTLLWRQIAQVFFPNEHCGPGYSSM